MVLDRRMFRRPSQIAPNKGPSSKGVGITSGLTQPVQKFAKGDFVERFRETRAELEPVLKDIYKEPSFLQNSWSTGIVPSGVRYPVPLYTDDPSKAIT